MPKTKEIQKVVQKLSREQESAAGGGGGGTGGTGGTGGAVASGGVRTGTKIKSHLRYTGVT